MANNLPSLKLDAGPYMTVFAIDVQLAGTAYIKAQNEADALRQLKEIGLQVVYLDVLTELVSDEPIDCPDLPTFSLSPVATLYGAWPGAPVEEAE